MSKDKELKPRVVNFSSEPPESKAVGPSLLEYLKGLPIESHRVVCDETNNTEESIDKGQLRATVEIKQEFETYTGTIGFRARAFRTFKLTNRTRKQKKRIRKKRRRWYYCLNGAKTGQVLHFQVTIPKYFFGADCAGPVAIIGTASYGPE